MSHLAKWATRTVLVVDDSASYRAIAIEIFKNLGVTDVLEAENGVAALAIITSTPIDLVLTDLNMPGMDGIELLNKLARAKDKKICFIAVMSSVAQSVLDTVQSIADASSLELLGIFPKPMCVEYLRKILDRFDPEMRMISPRLSDLKFSVSDVVQALNCGELEPYFQPKVRFSDAKLCGMEALVRWIHPVYGVLPPNVFVEHLETGTLAKDFFLNFLQLCCVFLKTLPATPSPLSCSINFPVPLLTDESIVDAMVGIVEENGLSTDMIVLELTETSLMIHLADSLSSLARLRMRGFTFAMDDYGTGYSSMSQLARCPFSELKIDREFVHNATNSPKKLAILHAAIALCERLNLLSVAEGVETQEDWNLLETLGCEVAQGYFISRPIAADAMKEWLLTHL